MKARSGPPPAAKAGNRLFSQRPLTGPEGPATGLLDYPRRKYPRYRVKTGRGKVFRGEPMDHGVTLDQEIAEIRARHAAMIKYTRARNAAYKSARGGLERPTGPQGPEKDNKNATACAELDQPDR